jgi:hypothetical protein
LTCDSDSRRGRIDAIAELAEVGAITPALIMLDRSRSGAAIDADATGVPGCSRGGPRGDPL